MAEAAPGVSASVRVRERDRQERSEAVDMVRCRYRGGATEGRLIVRDPSGGGGGGTERWWWSRSPGGDMSDRARLGVVLKGDRAFDEPSSPLSDQALLPAVLKDDDAQRNGGSHANFPKASCSETRGRGDAEADCVACLLLFKSQSTSLSTRAPVNFYVGKA